MSASVDDIRSVLPSIRQTVFAKPNVVAVGIGYKMVQGKPTDQLCAICSVELKKTKAELTVDELIPAAVAGITTDVIETGKIVAQQDPKGRFRPAPGGVSVGHRDVTAGTLGCWVKKNGEFHILSNNHVLANSNNGSIGDAILQPGSYDSGVYPKDKIAELAEFVPINFEGGDNVVDAAIAKAVEGEDGGSSCPIAGAISSLLNHGASGIGSRTRLKPIKIANIGDVVLDEILNIGKITQIAEPQLNMDVKKMGRTTEVTYGRIMQIDVSVNVGYGNRSAYFVDQFVTGNMSQGGDSGSAVLSSDNKLVGLLFAGSEAITVMNRIQNVFAALNISF